MYITFKISRHGKMFLAALAVATAAALSPADFEIKELPGLKGDLGFKQYAGLMPIGDAFNT